MHFYKYQGTGNDFVMIDDRNKDFDIKATERVKLLCDRRFGIGADGLILLRNSEQAHFEMVYFNSDGNLSSMCGNGGRCIARFAQQLNIIDRHCTFMAIDGLHHATLDSALVSLKMNDVTEVENGSDYYYLNTGSPHVVKYVDDINTLDVFESGREIRYNERFKNVGTNVNFVAPENAFLKIRTYERGVENETLSCGTGITATAIADAIKNSRPAGKYTLDFEAQGGLLSVTYVYDGIQSFTNVHLIGPANYVFEGNIDLI